MRKRVIAWVHSMSLWVMERIQVGPAIARTHYTMLRDGRVARITSWPA